jgi:hypothetical protein
MFVAFRLKSRWSRLSGGDRGFVLLVGRVMDDPTTKPLGVMDDPTKYKTFKWWSSDPKLAKAVKAKVSELMREAPSYRKTSVAWHEVRFVATGVVIPFKTASVYRTTYAWLYRAIMPCIAENKATRECWVWEPVESEAATDGAPTSLEGQETNPSGDAAGSGLRDRGAGAEAAGRGLELFPPSVALKISRGSPWSEFVGWWVWTGHVVCRGS